MPLRKDQQSQKPQKATAASSSRNQHNVTSSDALDTTPFHSADSFNTARETTDQFQSAESESMLPTTTAKASRQAKPVAAVARDTADKFYSLDSDSELPTTSAKASRLTKPAVAVSDSSIDQFYSLESESAVPVASATASRQTNPAATVGRATADQVYTLQSKLLEPMPTAKASRQTEGMTATVDHATADQFEPELAVPMTSSKASRRTKSVETIGQSTIDQFYSLKSESAVPMTPEKAFRQTKLGITVGHVTADQFEPKPTEPMTSAKTTRQTNSSENVSRSLIPETAMPTTSAIVASRETEPATSVGHDTADEFEPEPAVPMTSEKTARQTKSAETVSRATIDRFYSLESESALLKTSAKASRETYPAANIGRTTVDHVYSLTPESPMPTTLAKASSLMETTAATVSHATSEPKSSQKSSDDLAYKSAQTTDNWLSAGPSSAVNVYFSQIPDNSPGGQALQTTTSSTQTNANANANAATQEQFTTVDPATVTIAAAVGSSATVTKSDSANEENASQLSAREYDYEGTEGANRVKKLTKHRPPPTEEDSSSDKAETAAQAEEKKALELWSSSTSTSLESEAFISPRTTSRSASRTAMHASADRHKSSIATNDPLISDEGSLQRFLQAKMELRAQMPKQHEDGPKTVQLAVPEDHMLSSEESEKAKGPPKHNDQLNDKDKKHNDWLLQRQSSESIHSEDEQTLRRFTTNLSLGNAFIYMVLPPDGGYGWLIVLISFLCQVIVDGIIFAVGILLPYIGEDMEVSSTRIIFVASIQVGPIATALINKFGFRPVALGGAVSACVSISVASFSPDIDMLIFFYSVLGGPSLSLIWVSSQLIIGYYFERYRPIANGISCSGAGAGILIFSYMNSQIIPKIGWRNTSRVHVGFLLTILLMAITFIEVAPTKVARINEDPEETTSSSEPENVFDIVNSIRYSRSYSIYQKPVDRGIEQMLEEYEAPVEESRIQKFVEKWCPCFRDMNLARKVSDFAMGKRYVIRNDPVERQDLYYTGTAEYPEEPPTTRKTAHGQTLELLTEERARNVEYTLSVMHSAREAEARRLTLREIRRRHKHAFWAFISPANWLPRKLVNAFNLLFDFKLLRIMEFQVLILSAFFFPMGFNIPFVYSKTRAEVPELHQSLISPTIGFTNFVFRIASGFAANKYKEYTTYICGGGMVFGGMAVLVSAFYGEDVVWFQYVYAACYGVAPAFFSTLRAIIYVRALGLDKLTNAFGLTGLAMGLGVFIGTTTAAVLNSATGSYSAAFCFSGMCLMLAGGLKLILPTLIALQASRRTKP